MRCTTCRLIHLFCATECEAAQYKDLISVVFPKLNACRVPIRVFTTNNILSAMRGLTLPLKIFEKGVLSEIEMRGLAKM